MIDIAARNPKSLSRATNASVFLLGRWVAEALSPIGGQHSNPSLPCGMHQPASSDAQGEAGQKITSITSVHLHLAAPFVKEIFKPSLRRAWAGLSVHKRWSTFG